MHPYIKHLLSDIKGAEKPDEDPIEEQLPKSFEEEMEEIERWVSSEGETPLSRLTNLNKEDFPPPEQLTEKDMEAVLGAYDNMLATWNISVDYPEVMPTIDRYKFLRKTILKDKVTPMSFGFVHLDYCTGNPEGCEWGKYCSCLDYYNELTDEDLKLD